MANAHILRILAAADSFNNGLLIRTFPMNPLRMTITDFRCVSFGAVRKCRGDAPGAVIVLCLGRIYGQTA
jgi:hypothetical protein